MLKRFTAFLPKSILRRLLSPGAVDPPRRLIQEELGMRLLCRRWLQLSGLKIILFGNVWLLLRFAQVILFLGLDTHADRLLDNNTVSHLPFRLVLHLPTRLLKDKNANFD